MKLVTKQNKTGTFQPFNLTLCIETEEDAKRLHSLFNHTTILNLQWDYP